MKAIEIINVVLRHTVDAPYTIEDVIETSDATIRIEGYYHPAEGCIEDQLTIGLRTYFAVSSVWTEIEPSDGPWYKYSAKLTRRPAFARVPVQVTR
jgi:hypothetical protein